jgi:hypothetical protein
MEHQISLVIKDKIHVPTSRQFLRIYARACGLDKDPKLTSLARFYIDLALVMHLNKQFKPSIIAIGALMLSLNRMRATNKWQRPYEQLSATLH